MGFAALTSAAACAAVDIRPSAPNTILEMRSRFFRGHYELRNATVVDLIDAAWSVDPVKVVGGPDWLDTDRFDVTADLARGDEDNAAPTPRRPLPPGGA